MTSALDVGALILARMGPIDSWKLQKLVYYSQAWHLALFDRPLFSEPVQAWPDGPVVRELWHEHRGRRMVDSVRGGDPRALTQQDTLLVDLVCDHYGALSGADLSDMTHRETPWLNARDGLADRAPSKRAIKHEVMTDFYRSRDLAGRSAADLIAGGLWPPADDSDERIRQHLDEIREDFAEPGHPPEQEDVFSAQFATAPHHPSVPRRRGQMRPARNGRA